MNINTYTAPIYLVDEIEELIRLFYSENDEIRSKLEEFNQYLLQMHNFTRTIGNLSAGKCSKSEFLRDYNRMRSEISMILHGK